MIDKDDKYTYSAIVAIEMPVIAFNMSILPNPVRQSWLSISVNTPTNQNGELTILDMTGRPLKKLPVFLQAGKNNLPLPLDGLSTGYYYLHFRWHIRAIEDTSLYKILVRSIGSLFAMPREFVRLLYRILYSQRSSIPFDYKTPRKAPCMYLKNQPFNIV